MDNGIYIALSRQAALFLDMAVTANNIANVATKGYQGEKMMFDDYLVKSGNEEKKMAFVNDVSTYRDTREGAMESTGNPLDLAISGDGYFTVSTPAGTRYTRNGSFQIDANGTLVTSQGYPVLDAGGNEIQFGPEDTNITVGENGVIRVNGGEAGTVSVVEFANPQMMQRTSETLLSASTPGQPAANSRVLQGVLENSNVQPVLELTHMLKVSRNVAGTAKLIDAQYDLGRRTADTWAKQAS